MAEGHHHGEDCGCGHHGGHGPETSGCGCGGHHGGGHGEGCGCEGHHGHHHAGHWACGCGGHCGHHWGGCSCGGHHGGGCCREGWGHGRGFWRRFPNRTEQAAELEAYLKELEAEAQGVREAIEALRPAHAQQ